MQNGKSAIAHRVFITLKISKKGDLSAVRRLYKSNRFREFLAFSQPIQLTIYTLSVNALIQSRQFERLAGLSRLLGVILPKVRLNIT